MMDYPPRAHLLTAPQRTLATDRNGSAPVIHFPSPLGNDASHRCCIIARLRGFD